jgi:hypothetical protein
MADSPITRREISQPFIHISLEFSGLKTIGLKQKPEDNFTCYNDLCISVCHTTKAVHIKVAEELTSETMKTTLEKFIAIKGLPSSIYNNN